MAILALLAACKLVQIKVTWQYIPKATEREPTSKTISKGKSYVWKSSLYTSKRPSLQMEPNPQNIYQRVCRTRGEEGTQDGALNSL